MRKISWIVFVAAVTSSGCASLGPQTISMDRLAYIQQISESWKEQMLLNIVKLRYLDPPAFLDVTSVINQYGIERRLNADARWYWPRPADSAYEAGLGGYETYSDKPTITYSPLTGQKFTQNLLAPIPPAAVISIVRSGWPIDIIFAFAVKSINGVRNQSLIAASLEEGSQFNHLINSMRAVQLAGVSDIRIEKVGERETVIFVISDDSAREESRQESEKIRSILKLKPDAKKYTVVLGTLASSDSEIALSTRSMLEIMLEMSAAVEVPAQHVKEGRTRETPSFAHSESPFSMRVHSGPQKPHDVFVSIPYRNHWFWIDDTDIVSKRNFTLLMIFLSLTETDQKANSPLFTIGG